MLFGWFRISASLTVFCHCSSTRVRCRIVSLIRGRTPSNSRFPLGLRARLALHAKCPQEWVLLQTKTTFLDAHFYFYEFESAIIRYASPWRRGCKYPISRIASCAYYAASQVRTFAAISRFCDHHVSKFFRGFKVCKHEHFLFL